eukprot:5941263-Karenia_brevis.AAC.1
MHTGNLKDPQGVFSKTREGCQARNKIKAKSVQPEYQMHNTGGWQRFAAGILNYIYIHIDA